MSIDMTIGLLIGLALVCVGGLVTMLVMYWQDLRADTGGHGGEALPPAPVPPSVPGIEIPDFIPAEWMEEAA